MVLTLTVSFMGWEYATCSGFGANYVGVAGFFPTGNCFTASARNKAYPVIPNGGSNKLTCSSTDITIQSWSSSDCTGGASTTTIPRNTCYNPTQYSFIFDCWDEYDDLSELQDWWTGWPGLFGNETWETIIATEAYSDDCDTDFVSIQFAPLKECQSGVHFYCDDDLLKVRSCSENDCTGNCDPFLNYPDLNETCRINMDEVDQWYTYLAWQDGSNAGASHYKIKCYGNNSHHGKISSAHQLSICVLLLICGMLMMVFL